MSEGSGQGSGTTPGPAASPRKPLAVEPREVDLDAMRAARAEAATDQPAPTVKFGGKVYTLPRELPVQFIDDGKAANLRSAFGCLLGDQADEFFKNTPTVNDLYDLSSVIWEMYGVTEGEAPASSGS